MPLLSTLLQQLASSLTFPARLQIFGDDQALKQVVVPPAAIVRWPEASFAVALAAACGAAVMEDKRKGQVVLLISQSPEDSSAARAAVSMMSRLKLSCLTLVVIDHAMPEWLSHIVASLDTSCVRVERVATEPTPTEQPLPPAQQPWPPVALGSVAPGQLPGWPVDILANPWAVSADWLSWLQVREPHLVVADRSAPWRDLALDTQVLLALASVACEGRRVCCRAPRGSPIVEWLDALHEIGDRHIAFKLLLSTRDLPSRTQLAALTGWWLLVPNDVSEAAAMLAFALACEDPVMIALPERTTVALPEWKIEEPYLAGSGRWLERDGVATLLCDHRTLSAAAQAMQQLANEHIHVRVLITSTLMPVPVGDLDRLPPAPLFACGSDLSVAWASALIDRDARIITIRDGEDANAIVEVVTRTLNQT